MKAFVITIEDNHLSNKAADRCIASAKRYGVTVEKWSAMTPRNPIFEQRVKESKIAVHNFESGHSRKENALACFLSHMSLWEKCIEDNEEILILEHDALFTNYVPKLLFDKIITIGQPSYGKYYNPSTLGIQPLSQKEYFKGAHAYIVKPAGARDLIAMVPDYSRPTDVYLNIMNFPYLQEYYPWPVKVDDSFTTIQMQQGCIAKHNYEKGIELVEA